MLVSKTNEVCSTDLLTTSFKVSLTLVTNNRIVSFFRLLANINEVNIAHLVVLTKLIQPCKQLTKLVVNQRVNNGVVNLKTNKVSLLGKLILTKLILLTW